MHFLDERRLCIRSLSCLRSNILCTLGKKRSKVRISLSDAVQHGSARDILEGSLEVKSNKDSGVVGFRKVLDGLDHRVCTFGSSNTVLQWSSTLGVGTCSATSDKNRAEIGADAGAGASGSAG